MSRSIPGLLRRAAEVGPAVLAFRGRQAVQLAVTRATGFWERLPADLATKITAPAAERWRAQRSPLLAPGAVDALRGWAVSQQEWRARQRLRAAAVRQGQVEVFDRVERFDPGAIPWRADWRHEHHWPNRYFHAYRFHERQKARPYDVKFPWELSRLALLIPLVQETVLTWEPAWLLEADRLLQDWVAANPVAYSVNWAPMEASIRAVTLALATAMGAASGALAGEPLARWLRVLAAHGEFVARTVEWSDVNNNHYIANLVALEVLGCCLAGVYPPAGRWAERAAPRLWREVQVEYLPDGVNYEKAIGYHRLVTELCLLALLAARRAGRPAPLAVASRLGSAVDFAVATCRPDGWLPAVGDNDSSRILVFDGRHTRDPGELVALGSAWCGRPGTDAVASAAVPWLLAPGELVAGGRPAGSPHSFPSGGFEVAREGGAYLLVDTGEVGLAGRGGHGHNDLLSFELQFGGEAVIVDPGVPCYTGDPAAHRAARLTAAHNSLVVDGVEIAPWLGTWRLGADAVPLPAVRGEADGVVSIRGGHRGYAALPDSVVHRREFRFDPRAGRLDVEDRLECRAPHDVGRFLHLAPGITASLEGDAARLHTPGGASVVVTWDPGTRASLEDGEVWDAYGLARTGRILVLASRYDPGAVLRLSIAHRSPSNAR